MRGAAGTSWSREVLDGNGGSGGRMSGDIGTDASAVVQNGKIHVFYRAVGSGNLRHASWSGSAWTFATLDGASTSGGRVDADVGVGNSAFLFNNAVNVTYFNATAGDLRRAVLNGSAWTFETLDGAGGADGRTANVVGRASTAAVASNQLFLWYRDDTAKDLRLARTSGSTWSFSTLDGNGGGRGRTTNDVASVASGAALGAEPHVWYYDATGGDLRHGWRNTSNEWTFETVDGNGGSAGRDRVRRRDVHSGGHVRFDGGRPLSGRDRRGPAQRILQRRGMVILHPRRRGAARPAPAVSMPTSEPASRRRWSTWCRTWRTATPRTGIFGWRPARCPVRTRPSTPARFRKQSTPARHRWLRKSCRRRAGTGARAHCARGTRSS